MTQDSAPGQPPVQRQGRRCPNCKTPMKYIEFFDGHRCPACITITKPDVEGKRP